MQHLLESVRALELLIRSISVRIPFVLQAFAISMTTSLALQQLAQMFLPQVEIHEDPIDCDSVPNQSTCTGTIAVYSVCYD